MKLFKKSISCLLTLTFLTVISGCGKKNNQTASGLDTVSNMSSDMSTSSLQDNSSNSAVYSDALIPQNEQSVDVSTEMKKPTFTDKDIDTIHDIFNTSSIINPDEPFDFTDGNTDIDTVLNFMWNWQKYIFKDTQPDISYEEYTEDWSIQHALFKPETLEKIIQEKLIPDINLSEYDYVSTERFWNKEKQMFQDISVFFPEGYIKNIYNIIDEGTVDDLYYISVELVTMENEYYHIGCLDNILHATYYFRKLPNDIIAPCKMVNSNPPDWEIKACQTADKMLTIYDNLNEQFAQFNLSFYSDDFYNDGKQDFVATGLPPIGNNPRQITIIYNDFDINQEETKYGILYFDSSTNEIWSLTETLMSSTAFMEVDHTYYNSNGKTIYQKQNITEEKTIPSSETNSETNKELVETTIYKHNDDIINVEEFNNAIGKLVEIKYDNYLNPIIQNNKLNVFEYINYCREHIDNSSSTIQTNINQ